MNAYSKSRADVPEGTRRLQDMVEQSKAKVEAAQEVIERRGGFTADEVFKPKGEDWSAQRVRGATGSVFTSPGHEFCGMTEADLRARYAVNIPASVTLEGLAAVIGALMPALVSGGDDSIRDDVVALSAKARELATGKPAPLVQALAETVLHEKTSDSHRLECATRLANLVLGRCEQDGLTAPEADKHAEAVAADIAACEVSGQAEANRKARQEAVVKDPAPPYVLEFLTTAVKSGASSYDLRCVSADMEHFAGSERKIITATFTMDPREAAMVSK